MENRSEIENFKKAMKNMCISLEKFLINYCGIYSEEFHNIKITHQDIKKLIPNLKRVSFEYLIGNKKELYIGNVIAVKDSLENIVPYVNPMLEITEIKEVQCEKKKEEVIKEIIIDENISFYEALELCRYYKTHNKLKEYRIVHKILENLKDPEIKQYKKKKDNLIVKGRGIYDEY